MKHDVVIVGAGAAGVGCAAALKDFGVQDCLVIDRYGVGASFESWPAEMRLITPSFNTTPFGILDLNAVTLNTSVANFLGCEHPTGREYARYLRAVVREMKLSVLTPWEVQEVEDKPEGGFSLRGPQGTIECNALIWAAGEFQFPREEGFPGAEFCLHNSRIGSYAKLPGTEHIVIGAFESGIDAAIHLANLGRRVTLLSAEKQLALFDQDPSRSLSPYTRERLAHALASGSKIRIFYESRVEQVARDRRGFHVRTSRSETFSSSSAPILAIGFRSGIGPVKHLFDYRPDGELLLTENDESTITSGLFVAGPMVRHDHHIFCFIYKFRQRFAVIAETIAKRLGIPVSEDLLAYYDKNQMRLIDLSCCGQKCAC
jgi:thioredoxin reductase